MRMLSHDQHVHQDAWKECFTSACREHKLDEKADLFIDEVREREREREKERK
jgi:hypothetical protein